MTGISHDSVSRFLNRKDYQLKNLFEATAQDLCLVGGTLSIDDTVLDKPYSHSVALASHFWPGKHHRAVKGINFSPLQYDLSGRHMPVNFRICDKSEGKTKNNYFCEMLIEVLACGLKPAFVTGDSWYGFVKGLKTIKNHHAGVYVCN